MANAVITDQSSGLGSSGIGALMTVLADEFLAVKRYRGRTVSFCNTNGTSQPGIFDTVRFMIPAAGTAINSETDGTAPNLDDTPGSYVDVQCHQHLSAFFGVSQLGETLDGGRSLAPLMAGRTADLFNYVEADISALASTFSASVGTGHVALTETVLDSARTLLINAQVPQGVPMHAVLAPGTNSWVAVSNFADFNEYRISSLPSPMKTGEFGVEPIWYKNAYFCESQSVKTATVSANTYTYNYMMSPDAICVAFKSIAIPPAGSGVQATNYLDPESGIEFQILSYFDQTKHGQVFKIHTAYGRAIGRSDWGVVLLS